MERSIFWLGFWACFGKSMAAWLVLVVIGSLFADTTYVTPFSIISGFVVWAVMAAVWSSDQGKVALRRWEDQQHAALAVMDRAAVPGEVTEKRGTQS